MDTIFEKTFNKHRKLVMEHVLRESLRSPDKHTVLTQGQFIGTQLFGDGEIQHLGHPEDSVWNMAFVKDNKVKGTLECIGGRWFYEQSVHNGPFLGRFGVPHRILQLGNIKNPEQYSPGL